MCVDGSTNIGAGGFGATDCGSVRAFDVLLDPNAYLLHLYEKFGGIYH